MKKLLIILLSALSLTAVAQQRIAILEPSSSGTSIDDGTRIAIRELISSAIVNTNKYTIVERALLEKVIKEQHFSQSGLVDEAQAIQIGKLTGASKVILSVVTATGNRTMLSIKLLDVTTANIEKQKAKLFSSAELLDAVEPMTKELLGESISKQELRLGQVVTINGLEGTVIRLDQDKQSGLVIAHTEAYAFNHDAAQKYTDAIGKPWRLPTVQEAIYITSHLTSINEFLTQNNGKKMYQRIYWSSSRGEDEWSDYYKRYQQSYGWFFLDGSIHYCTSCGSSDDYARVVAIYHL